MTEQDTLALEATCKCGAQIPYQGVGRPRSTCDDCRPPTWPPLASERLHKVPRPLSRNSDPETSREAAASVDSGAVASRIIEAFEQFGWLSAFECADVLDDLLESTVRTRVSALGRSGALVKTGTTRTNRHGRQSQVWKLADA